MELKIEEDESFELTPDGDEEFDQRRLGPYREPNGIKKFKKFLRSKNYDRVSFKGDTLSHSEIQSAVLNFYKSAKPLRSFSVQGAFNGLSEEKYQNFMTNLLKQQASNLTTLRVVNEMLPNMTTCSAINNWLKQENCHSLMLQLSTLEPKEIDEIFKSSEEEPLHLKILNLQHLNYLVDGWVPKNMNLMKLSLWQVTMTEGAFKNLCTYVESSHTLNTLDLREVVKKVENGKRLGKAVAANKSLLLLKVLLEETDVVIPIIKNMVQSESLTSFRYRPIRYPCNFDPVFETLREVLPQARALLVSLSFGRTPIPLDIKIVINRNILHSKKQRLPFGNMMEHLSKGTAAVENCSFRCVLVGNGSHRFLEELMKQPTEDKMFVKSLAEKRDPVLLLKKQSSSNNEETLQPVAIGISDQANANAVLRSLELTPVQEHIPVSDIPMEDQFIKYCSETNQDILHELPNKSFHVGNCWVGLGCLKSTMPFLRDAKEAGGVYLVSFLMSKLLGAGLSTEIKMISSLVRRFPKTVPVFLVGLVDDALNEEVLADFNLNLASYKRFVSKNIFQHISNVDGGPSPFGAEQESLFFLNLPLDVDNNVDDYNSLWRAIDKSLVVKGAQIDPRWYMVLSAVKSLDSKAAYRSFASFKEEALNLGLPAEDAYKLLNHFEQTGELLILSPASQRRESSPLMKMRVEEEELLIILKKGWVNEKLKGLCDKEQLLDGIADTRIMQASQAANLWDEEEEWVSKILKDHAKTLGLLFRINEQGEYFVPYANLRYNDLHEHYSKVPHLFWINMPSNVGLEEFFNVFSGHLLKHVLKIMPDENSRRIYNREKDTVRYRINSDIERAWARCDKRTGRIVLGLPEALQPSYGLWLGLCEDALADTNLFLDSTPTDIFSDAGELNYERLQRYPHISFRVLSRKQRFVEIPYFALEASQKPKELENFDVDIQRLGQAVKAVKTAKPDQILLESLKFREKVDVRLVSDTEEETEKLFLQFLVSLLQLGGLSADWQDLHTENLNDCKVIVVLFGKQMDTRDLNGEHEEKHMVEVKRLLEYASAPIFVRVMNKASLLTCQTVFPASKSLGDQGRADLVLDEFVADMLNAVSSQAGQLQSW